MTVDKHGKLYDRRFTCGTCECEFHLDPGDDVEILFAQVGGVVAAVYCPECGGLNSFTI